MKLFLIVLILAPAITFGQQDGIFTQFWNSQSRLNPAVSGLYKDLDAAILYRNQWTGVNGAPRVFLAVCNTNINNKHGLGINYEYDVIGFTREQKLNFNYNYQILLKYKGANPQRLSIGGAIGYVHQRVDPAWIPPVTEDDTLLSTPHSSGGLNFNAGVAYKDESFFAGIGITHLTEQSLIGVGLSFTMRRHYYLMLSKRIRFKSAKRLDILPRLIFRTDAVKTSGDINIEFGMLSRRFDRYWFGFGYRISDAYILTAGCDIANRYRIGYSYGLTINSLEGISNGTHEFVLGFHLNRVPPPPPPPASFPDF